MMQEYWVRRMRETYGRRQEALAAIRTPPQAKRYRDHVRRAIRRSFGPFPGKTPLNASVLKTSDFGEFIVDHVLYESRPGFMVSANLYLPRLKPGRRAPGILFTCGHSDQGKAYPLYAGMNVRLAREGYASLCYDPINQGERELYTLLGSKSAPLRSSPCHGHNIVGNQLMAMGEWFGAWRLWDGMRGVDYMLTRPEIDARFLGVTGQSGGGTLSAYLWANDRRLKMAASSCWTTRYLLDIENGMPADNEQYPPGFVADGLDKIDFFIARAGEPALLLGQELDIFDDRGLKQGYQELLKLHRMLGGDTTLCELSMDTGEHAYSEANQRAAVKFFNRALGRGAPVRRRAVALPTEDQLKVTPECNVNRFGSIPMYEIMRKEADRLCASRKKIGRQALADVVARVLSVKLPDAPPHHRRMFQTARTRKGSTQRIYRFVVEPEAGIQCVLRHVCRDKTPFRMDPDRDVTLYLPNVCSQRELDGGTVPDGAGDCWLLDVRGSGESAHSPDDVFSPYGHDYMHAGHAWMYNETLLGARVTDVLNAVALLRAEGAKRVHLVGRGQGGILALLVGVLDRSITDVASLKAPESIERMVKTPVNFWPAANFPKHVLKHFDLPDLRMALGKRLIRDTRAHPGRFTA